MDKGGEKLVTVKQTAPCKHAQVILCTYICIDACTCKKMSTSFFFSVFTDLTKEMTTQASEVEANDHQSWSEGKPIAVIKIRYVYQSTHVILCILRVFWSRKLLSLSPHFACQCIQSAATLHLFSIPYPSPKSYCCIVYMHDTVLRQVTEDLLKTMVFIGPTPN